MKRTRQGGAALGSFGSVSPVPEEKSRMPLMLAAILWISSLVLIFVGVRLRMKPILLVGAFELLLALFVTTMVFGPSLRR